MTDIGQSREYDRTSAAAAMPSAFGAFLGRFGEITGIQSKAFPVILDGGDTVLVAPAASGKTEAALTPLFEIMIRRKSTDKAVGILYIVPTRALANDIESRVNGPVTALGLRCRIRTGDRPSPVGNERIDLLITTPESFDSLLCRHPAAFDHLQAIVVDEAHLMDRTARGDQMKVLIRRVMLKKSAARPMLIAMTATVSDPSALSERLLGVQAGIVVDNRRRPVDATMEDDLTTALATLRRERLSKAIIFCNTKRQVEETAAEAARTGPWPPERVMVHHASLARREREDVEKAFKYFEAGLLISTSTMELGVDIGDVDAVVLVGAPDSVASLQQRVGRGCRRRNGMRALFVPVDKNDPAAFEALMKDRGGADMSDTPWRPDLSVTVQQIFSLLFENRKGLKRKTLRRILDVVADGRDIDLILDHLRSTGFLEEGADELMRASATLMDMGEKGRIHSNISDSARVKVVDSATGRTVGLVSSSNAPGSAVAIGGKTYTVTGSSRSGVSVRVSGVAAGESEARFGSRGDAGAFSRYLPDELKKSRSG